MKHARYCIRSYRPIWLGIRTVTFGSPPRRPYSLSFNKIINAQYSGAWYMKGIEKYVCDATKRKLHGTGKHASKTNKQKSPRSG